MPSFPASLLPGGSPLAHHVHLHLAASAATLDLFGRSEGALLDPDTRNVVGEIRGELQEGHRALQSMAAALGVGESRVLTLAARAGERLGRLKPNGSLTQRTDLTDVVELEAMRTAVTGIRAGWQALLSVTDVHPVLDQLELQELVGRSEDHQSRLAAAHTRAAVRALLH